MQQRSLLKVRIAAVRVRTTEATPPRSRITTVCSLTLVVVVVLLSRNHLLRWKRFLPCDSNLNCYYCCLPQECSWKLSLGSTKYPYKMRLNRIAVAAIFGCVVSQFPLYFSRPLSLYQAHPGYLRCKQSKSHLQHRKDAYYRQPCCCCHSIRQAAFRFIGGAPTPYF